MRTTGYSRIIPKAAAAAAVLVVILTAVPVILDSREPAGQELSAENAQPANAQPANVRPAAEDGPEGMTGQELPGEQALQAGPDLAFAGEGLRRLMDEAGARTAAAAKEPALWGKPALPEDAALQEEAREELRREAGMKEAEKAAEEARCVRDHVPDLPEIDPGSWEFILANPWNDIGDYTPELETLEGQKFDVRIIGPMKDFVQAARDEGLSVYLSSGYRGYNEQSYLFRRKAEEYGEAVAATIVARPGTSEHQTGLCCDITDRYYEQKDRSLEETELYQWMSAHCREYGFIVRFPEGKEDITGIIYEPWHFRYVGIPAAEYIMEHDLTLEEFLELYEAQ